jgi:hypothetical protein
MQVDGREVAVAGSLLQPLLRRGDDLRRLVLAALISALAAAGSAMVPEDSVVALERSISRIVGVLSPDWSGRLYLMYGSTLIFLPLGILFSLSVPLEDPAGSCGCRTGRGRRCVAVPR